MNNPDSRQMALWIDHVEARVFHVEGETFDESTVHAPNHHVQRHPKRQETDTHRYPQDEPRFFSEVIKALEDADEILILGPSVTKLHFLRYAQTHAPAVARHIVGIESADHPTDRQLIAHVRHYFHSERPRLGLPT